MSEDAGYASPIVADVQGVRTIMTLTVRGRRRRPRLGRQADVALYAVPPTAPPTSRRRSTPTTRCSISSAYGTGGALVGLRPAGGEIRAQEIYFTRDMQNHHGGVVLVERLPVRLQQLDPDLPRLGDRQDDVARPQRRQGHHLVRRRPSLHRSARTTSSASSRRRPPAIAKRAGSRFRDQGWPSWAHPGDCRRAALRPQPGDADQLRLRACELTTRRVYAIEETMRGA